MKKKINKNAFEKMCDKLDESYVLNENEVEHVKRYLASSKVDRDMLLKIKAEASVGDYSTYLSNRIAVLALLFTAIGVVVNMLPEMQNDMFSLVINIFYLLMMMYATVTGLMNQNFKTVGKWRGYVLVAVDEMLNEKKYKRKKQ